MRQETRTPGPWKLDIQNDGGNWDYHIREANPSSHPTIGKHIATVNKHLNAEANAALIAAAPDLLEALKAANDLINAVKAIGVDIYNIETVHEEVNEVIARAEGRHD